MSADTIAKRLEGFKKAYEAARRKTDEVNRLRLDRAPRRAALNRIADELAAEQDRVNALHPLDAAQGAA